jgi:glycosyltransferase involved in cell wall biosynthesis
MIGPDKGDGSLTETLSAAKSLAVSEHISIRGPITKAEVPDMLATGDIFLNTSRFDNTPVTVIEAMAAGLCVISTRAAGIPFLLSHEQDALLVPVDDCEAMAAGVRRLLTDQDLAMKLQRNANEKSGNFDWDLVLPRWETLLSSVIQTCKASKHSGIVTERERLV